MSKAFFRHVLESFKNMKRNFLMTVASISTAAVVLAMVGVFLSAILTAGKLASDIENDVHVSVFIGVGTKQPAMQQLKKEIAKVEHVKKITFSSKEQQLKDMQESLGDAWKLFQGDSNPLHDVYIVSADEPVNTKKVADEIQKLKNVDKAKYGEEKADKMIAFVEKCKVGGLIVAVALLLLAMFLISNTIRITILSRQTEIQIMRLVGAQNWFIRWPFFLEGAWIGLIGSLFSSGLIFWLYRVVYSWGKVQLLRSYMSMVPPATFLPPMLLLIVLLGMLIGSFGSIVAMRRFLKF